MTPLVLPWPHKDLSPNARVHYMQRASEARKAKAIGHVVAIDAGWRGKPLPDGRLHLWIDFYPPTRRLPDDDNMLTRFKPFRDGIALAMGIDDSRFVSHPYVKDEVRKGGQVVVRITGGAEA